MTHAFACEEWLTFRFFAGIAAFNLAKRSDMRRAIRLGQRPTIDARRGQLNGTPSRRVLGRDAVSTARSIPEILVVGGHSRGAPVIQLDGKWRLLRCR